MNIGALNFKLKHTGTAVTGNLNLPPVAIKFKVGTLISCRVIMPVHPCQPAPPRAGPLKANNNSHGGTGTGSVSATQVELTLTAQANTVTVTEAASPTRRHARRYVAL